MPSQDVNESPIDEKVGKPHERRLQQERDPAHQDERQLVEAGEPAHAPARARHVRLDDRLDLLSAD
jgi:hypothetical protein